MVWTTAHLTCKFAVGGRGPFFSGREALKNPILLVLVALWTA